MVVADSAAAQLLASDGCALWIDWLNRVYLPPRMPPSIRVIAAARSVIRWHWITLCDSVPLYQLWTRESVAVLTQALLYLSARRILEVGAGDGRLTRALHDSLTPHGILVAGQDDGSWALRQRTASPVWSLFHESFEATLARFRPDTVVCSWMPPETDWTMAFRHCPSVRQYLIIGEAAGGCTGQLSMWYPEAPWMVHELTPFQAAAAARTDAPTYSFTRAWVVQRP